MVVIGLVILVVGVVYLVLLVWATRAAYRWGKSKGFSKGKCWVTAAGGFLAVYLPLFWDFLPTLAAHHYYCATEAGFKVFKTIEQWKAENPGVEERLTWKDLSPYEILSDGTRLYLLNERIVWEARRRAPVALISTTLFEDLIKDRKTGEVLAKGVNVGSGYPNPMVASSDWRGFKGWLNLEPCTPMQLEFSEFRSAAHKMGLKR